MSFLIFLFIFFAVEKCQIIPIKYEQISGAYNIEFKIGEGDQSKYFEINLDLPFSFASSYHYSKKLSKTVLTYETTQIQIEDQQKTAEHLLEHLLITSSNGNNVTVKDFHFYYVHDFLDVYDSLSLSYKSKKEEFSLLNTLYENKQIGQRKFAMMEHGFKEGTLYLGGFPNNTVNDMNNYTCKINTEYDSWGCRLTKVIVGNNVYDNDDYALLQGNDRRVKVPSKFFNYLKEKYFNAYEKEGVCRYRNILRFNFYECLYNKTENFPSFTFVFDNFSLPFEDRQLYRKVEYDNNTYKQFFIEENVIEPTKWQFGIPLFRQYPVLFDYDDSSITFFYANKGILKGKIKTMLSIVTSVLLFIGIGNAIFMLLNKSSL